MAAIETAEVEHPPFEPTYTPGEDSGEFAMCILEEDVSTVDGRRFKPGSVTWRDLPIPLMFRTTNEGAAKGHAGSRVGGAITDVWKEGNKIYGSGHFSSNDDGQELRQLIAEGALQGVSADVGGATVELSEEDGKEFRTITEGKVLMVTVLPGQAFDDSRIAVTADGGPIDPPDDWFTNPGLKEPTALTVTDDGRVFGHAFTWGSCHIGVRDHCLVPPRSKSGYKYFAVGQVLTFGNTRVNTGVLTLDTDHAGIALSAEQSKRHYDHTGVQVADIAVGEDAIGGWFSGALRSNLTPEQVRCVRASAVSGDWRTINGYLELVGLLVVNTPGFPVPRANVQGDKALALVASGVVTHEGCDDSSKEKLRQLDLAVMDSVIFVNHNHTPGRGHPNQGGGGGGVGGGTPRELHHIAGDITRDWKKPYFGAVPYIHALRSLRSINDNYGHDSARSVVTYFLSNATTWRGDTARAVKAELKSMLKSGGGSFNAEFVNHNHTPGRGHPNMGGGTTTLTFPREGPKYSAASSGGPDRDAAGKKYNYHVHDSETGALLSSHHKAADAVAAMHTHPNAYIQNTKSALSGAKLAIAAMKRMKAANAEELVNHNHTPGRGHASGGGAGQASRAGSSVEERKAQARERGVAQAKKLVEEAKRRDTYTLASVFLTEFVNHNHTPGRGHANGGVMARLLAANAVGFGKRKQVREAPEHPKFKTSLVRHPWHEKAGYALGGKHLGPLKVSRAYSLLAEFINHNHSPGRGHASGMNPLGGKQLVLRKGDKVKGIHQRMYEKAYGKVTSPTQDYLKYISGLEAEGTEELVNHNHTPGRGHPNAGGIATSFDQGKTSRTTMGNTQVKFTRSKSTSYATHTDSTGAVHQGGRVNLKHTGVGTTAHATAENALVRRLNKKLSAKESQTGAVKSPVS